MQEHQSQCIGKSMVNLDEKIFSQFANHLAKWLAKWLAYGYLNPLAKWLASSLNFVKPLCKPCKLYKLCNPRGSSKYRGSGGVGRASPLVLLSRRRVTSICAWIDKSPPSASATQATWAVRSVVMGWGDERLVLI